AHDWHSITATAHDGVTLRGSGTINTETLDSGTGNIIVHSSEGNLNVNSSIRASGGGVELRADAGGIYSNESDPLNVSITGYSNGEDGVGLLNEDGVAAIVIRSHDSLVLGSDAVLIANGEYQTERAKDRDDREGVDSLRGPPETYETGDPFDATIYVGSFGRSVNGGGDVTVDASVSMDAHGTMVIDAENTIHDFGDTFRHSWENNDGTNRLELIARNTDTLNDVLRYGTLPGVRDVLDGKSPAWFNGSAYVLRGMRPAQVLRWVDAPPIPPMSSDDEDLFSPPWPPNTPIPDPELPIQVFSADGTPRKLEKGMALLKNDEIVTGPLVRAFIDFPDGSHIIMEPNTHIGIGSIAFRRGVTWFWRRARDARGVFKARFRNVTAGVRTTEFRISGDGEPRMVMIEGNTHWVLGESSLGWLEEREAAVIREDEIVREGRISDEEWDELRTTLNDDLRPDHDEKIRTLPLDGIPRDQAVVRLYY
ncbi:MAG: FecR domain-containing protein, partial [Phycisphaeraceae bacterium]|nr:FecR domain-containing protein [Phycisphaeraceae bacterium]